MIKKTTFLLFLFATYLGYAQPTTNTADPTKDASDVISIYSSGVYTDVATNYDPNWSQSGHTLVNTSYDPGTGSVILAYPNFNYQGTELTTQNASGMEYIHVDVWVAPGTDRMLKLSPINNGTGAGEFLVEVPLSPGSWNSVDLPKSSFTGMTWDSVFQFKFDGQFNGDGSANATPWDVYIDNLYFWKEAVSTNEDATLSDLKVDGVTINGFASSAFNYDVNLLNGTSTVPTVTGTATQAGMGSSNVSVSNAASLPGTTTVTVTAPDGTTTQDYTINFSILPPAAPTPSIVPAISLVSDVFTDVAIPEVNVFGGTLTNFNLNGSGNEETRSVVNGSGFQFNWFPGGAFVDISEAGFLHLDFYCDNLADGDVLRLRLIDDNPADGANIARYDFSTSQAGTWISIDLELPVGSDLKDFGDIDSAAGPVDLTKIALMQFNTADGTGTLAAKEILLSNIYFYGGTLSASSIDIATNNLKAYPNPTNRNWIIKAGNSAKIERIEIFDILGKSIRIISPNSIEAIIDSSNLRSGLYLAKVKTADGLQSLRLVKN